MIKIPDGNAFYLRITGTISTDDYIENADFSVVRNLIVNFVRRGRDAQDYEVDEEGRVVADCDGSFARGVYGIEMRGTFCGLPWRFFEKDLFKIVDESETADEPTESINGVPVYDITIEVTFGGNAVTAAYVDNAIDAHNTDEESHPIILEEITGIQADVAEMQNQINSIIAADAAVSLSASPSLVYIGEQNAISLSASTDTTAESIEINGGNISSPVSGSGESLDASDSITPTGNTTYTATFVIAGITKTATKTVTAVYPIYYGAGADTDAATSVASIRTSPAGTYNVTVETDGSYIYFLVPSTMTINGATMNGFDFPLDAAESITKDGVAYKAYRSSNSIDAGTHSITIR